jgi:hypothetical protein
MRFLSFVFLALAATATALIVGSSKQCTDQKEKDEFPLIVGDMPYAQSMHEVVSTEKA